MSGRGADPGAGAAPVGDRGPLGRAAEDALFDHLGRPPWATLALLAAVVGMHLRLAVLLHDRPRRPLGWAAALLAERGPRFLEKVGAMVGSRVDAGELQRLASCVFLHGGALHLLLNGVALFALGRLCEAVYGPARFLWLFMVAGVTGGLTSWVAGVRVSVGSSGAIFGLLGAAVVFGWRHRHQLPPETGAFFRVKLVPWLVLNLAVGFLVPVIDGYGHLGGLLGGSALAAMLGNRVVPGEDSGPLAHLGMALGAAALLGLAAWGLAPALGAAG